MWWNFVARDHDEIAAVRDDWRRNAASARSPPAAASDCPAPELVKR